MSVHFAKVGEFFVKTLREKKLATFTFKEELMILFSFTSR